jgi:uncharacterized membrane protein
MFEILSRCAQRPWAQPARVGPPGVCQPAMPPGMPFILHMRENRSSLNQPARRALAIMALVFMGCAILPALRGHWLVPAYAMASLAGLTFALDRHGRTRPRGETLEFAGGRLCHRTGDGAVTQWPLPATRLHAEERKPCDLRLFLRHGRGAVEIARCLGQEEKRAVMPLIAAGLARVRGAG